MNLDHNNVIVITGAASGIGLELAKQLSAKGCRLALADWNEAALSQLLDALGRPADEVISETFDVAQRASVESFASRVLDQFERVDAVINNAGVGHAQQVADMDYDDLDWVMGINFYGMVYGCKAFLPAMLEAGEGKMVFVSSVFGIVGIPTQSAYNASKFAIRGFAEALREEVRSRGVDVLVVHPGGIKTNIIRSGRIKDASGFGKSKEDPADRFERLARTSAPEAATQIVAAMKSDQQRLLIGGDAKLLDRIQRLFPASHHRKLKTLTKLLPK